MCRYELLHVVRTHMGADDASYDCVFQREDDAGKVGLFWQPTANRFVIVGQVESPRYQGASGI